MIQNKLAEYFEGKEIGQHLNGDEAAANGAVFQAANYSLIYKVRPIWVSDGYNFGIRMGINNKEGDIIEKKDIFGKREDFNNKISVEVNKIEELKLSFSMIYDENKEEYFKTIEITGIPDIKGGNYTNITNVAIILNITLCSMKGVDLKAYLKFEEHLFSEVEKSIYPENFTFPENYTSDDNSTINETLFTKVKEVKHLNII